MAELNPLKGLRQSSESDKAVIACNDWLRLGQGRTMPELLAKYQNTPKNTNPTSSSTTLYKWSKDFDWAQRAVEYDADWESQKNDRRAEVMDKGLSLDFERVEKLKRLAEFLEEQIYEQGATGKFHNVWLPDVKQIGSGEFAERVDLERFNAPLLSEFRATLDDLAKETGGRKLKTELTGADGGPVQVVRVPAKRSIDEWTLEASQISKT